MRNRVLLAGLLLCSIKLDGVQASPKAIIPSDRPAMTALVPQDDSARQDVETLEKAGVTLDFGGGMTLRTANTRRDFAVALSRQRYFLGLPPANPYATSINEIASYENLNSHPEAVEALISLINEFQPELRSIGINILQTKQQIFLHHPFFRVPLNDLAYAELDAVYRIINVPYDESGYPIYKYATVYEFASYIDRNLFLLELPGTPSQFSTLGEKGSGITKDQRDLDAQRRQVQQRLHDDPGAQRAFLSIVDQFAGVLDKLEVDVPHVKLRLIDIGLPVSPPVDIASSFPDVPKEHWAYQAVETVRQAGIIVGYPRGEFHTDDTEKGTPG